MDRGHDEKHVGSRCLVYWQKCQIAEDSKWPSQFLRKDGAMEKQISMMRESPFFGDDLLEPYKNLDGDV